MDFGSALKQLRKGSELTRTAWNDKHRAVKIVTIESSNGFGDPYQQLIRSERIQVGNYDRADLPYTPTATDILALDWEFLPR